MANTILVFHGITMCGSAMLRSLGPLQGALEDKGFSLLAPDAPHQMSERAVGKLLGWMRPGFEERGQDLDAAFSEGAFWDPGKRRDWFDARRDRETRQWEYAALPASISLVESLFEQHDVVGVLGFSQGCAMAAVAAALARQGQLPNSTHLRFGVFLSGFKPVFSTPALELWPVAGLDSLVLWGTEDAVFPDPRGIEGLAAALGAEAERIDGLPHAVPSSPAWVDRIAQFAADRV